MLEMTNGLCGCRLETLVHTDYWGGIDDAQGRAD